MRPVLPLFFVLLVVLPQGVRADDASKIAPDQQNTQLAPGGNNTDNRLTPGNANNQLPFRRDDRVQNSRFTTPDLRDKKMDPIGDRRAPFDMTETRGKNIIDRKDYPKPDVRDNKMNPDNALMYRDQPKGDMIKTYDMAVKYQDRMADAETAASRRQPKLEKRTTFDKINRFVFRRNGPGEENGNAMVTPAGGGTSAAVSGGTQKLQSAAPPPQVPQPK